MRTFFYIENVSFSFFECEPFNSILQHHQPSSATAPTTATAELCIWLSLKSMFSCRILFFTLPVTVPNLKQAIEKLPLLTIHFNLVPNFGSSIMEAYLAEKLTSYYRLGSELSISVQYDFLFCNYYATPKMFYIWRTNTNQTTLE